MSPSSAPTEVGQGGSCLEILIVSCDKYRDTWAPLAATFDTYWPDRPYQAHLLTNDLQFEHPRIRCVSVGSDVDWSSNLYRALQQLSCSHVLLWLDDVFPASPVRSQDVQRAYEFALAESANFVRLRPDPKPQAWRADGFGILAANASYRVSVFATIWRVETLLAILKPGESPWQFELMGSERAQSLPGFYCVRHAVFDYVHGIEKGLWLRDAVAWLQQRGHNVEQEYRREMNAKEHRAYRISRLKYHFMRMLPERYRKTVLHAARSFYLRFGMRRPEFYSK